MLQDCRGLDVTSDRAFAVARLPAEGYALVRRGGSLRWRPDVINTRVTIEIIRFVKEFRAR